MKNIMKFESGAEVDKILSIGNNPVAIVVEEQTISGVTIGGRYECIGVRNGYAGYGEMDGLHIMFDVYESEIKTGQNTVRISSSQTYINSAVINVTDLEYLDKKYIEPWTSYVPNGNVMKFSSIYVGPAVAYGAPNKDMKLGEAPSTEFSYVGEYVGYDSGDRWDAKKDVFKAMPSYEYRQPFYILYEWRNGSDRVYTEKRNPKPNDMLFDRYYSPIRREYVGEILEYGGGTRVDYNQTSEFTPGPIIGPIVPNDPI